MRALVISICAFFLYLSQAVGQSLPAPSTWKNQRGSEMKIVSAEAGGKFKGQYVNNAAGFGCQGVPYDLEGQVSGRRISFFVVWANPTKSCNSLTSWRGTLSADNISTRWELAYIDRSSGRVKILRGSDRFEKVK